VVVAAKVRTAGVSESGHCGYNGDRDCPAETLRDCEGRKKVRKSRELGLK
jgi:hypothetical protein